MKKSLLLAVFAAIFTINNTCSGMFYAAGRRLSRFVMPTVSRFTQKVPTTPYRTLCTNAPKPTPKPQPVKKTNAGNWWYGNNTPNTSTKLKHATTGAVALCAASYCGLWYWNEQGKLVNPAWFPEKGKTVINGVKKYLPATSADQAAMAIERESYEKDVMLGKQLEQAMLESKARNELYKEEMLLRINEDIAREEEILPSVTLPSNYKLSGKLNDDSGYFGDTKYADLVISKIVNAMKANKGDASIVIAYLLKVSHTADKCFAEDLIKEIKSVHSRNNNGTVKIKADIAKVCTTMIQDAQKVLDRSTNHALVVINADHTEYDGKNELLQEVYSAKKRLFKERISEELSDIQALKDGLNKYFDKTLRSYPADTLSGIEAAGIRDEKGRHKTSQLDAILNIYIKILNQINETGSFKLDHLSDLDHRELIINRYGKFIEHKIYDLQEFMK